MKNRAFTLAEVLITLAIIGIVAAMAVPSVISNAQQQEFKTGLRKAVSVLNSAITMNIALEGETPYDNKDLFRYLQRHMSVMKSTTRLDLTYLVRSENSAWNNLVFYTTDGMRFEFYQNERNGNTRAWSQKRNTVLYEDNSVYAELTGGGGCGSYGLKSNPNGTTLSPCLILVDINGDRKPNPENANCKNMSCAKKYTFSSPNGKKLTDVFPIMITDSTSIPYGTAAQKAMYQAQK